MPHLFSNWLRIFLICAEAEIKQFIGLAHRLWLRRNDVVHGGSMTHPTLLVQRTKVAIEDFAAATELGAGAHDNPNEGIMVRWQHPQLGWKKVNWEAFLASGKGWMGFGVLVRDEQGLVIAALSKTYVGSLNSLKAEAQAALMAVQFCKNLGLDCLHFEGDAQGLEQYVPAGLN
ncbi:uncharacterized protein LOC132190731 [Corylus avellana]|uniref:uncharacterized protein LOC132190731 n=1 Tax=Corylus avellana TaxID=13451 RepID=UPI00286A83FC|nr:uncharacterized protein LOC132190731 [Corylus avellana]